MFCSTPEASQQTHHFISQDAIDAIVVQVDEPVEALHLVLAHLAALDDRGLSHEPVACSLPSCVLISQQGLVLHLLSILSAMSSSTPAGNRVTSF